MFVLVHHHNYIVFKHPNRTVTQRDCVVARIFSPSHVQYNNHYDYVYIFVVRMYYAYATH